MNEKKMTEKNRRGEKTMSENIFQIWFRLGKLPFYVKRESWGDSYVKVEKITTGMMNHPITTENPYGFAYGTHYWSNGKIAYTKINCAGCYQWYEVKKDVEEVKK